MEQARARFALRVKRMYFIISLRDESESAPFVAGIEGVPPLLPHRQIRHIHFSSLGIHDSPDKEIGGFRPVTHPVNDRIVNAE